MDDLYKTPEERNDMAKMKDMDKTQILTERHQEASRLTYKLREHHNLKIKQRQIENERARK